MQVFDFAQIKRDSEATMERLCWSDKEPYKDPYNGRYDDDHWSYPIMEDVGFLVPGTNRVEEGTICKVEMPAYVAVMTEDELADHIAKKGEWMTYYSIAVRCEGSDDIKVWSGIEENQILGAIVVPEEDE